MKPNMFVSLFTAKTKNKIKPTSDEILNVITDIIKPVNYIKYDNKLKIIDKCFDDIKESKHPTADLQKAFVINMISAYTNIEMDNEGFDILSENSLLEIVLSTFKSEYETCSRLFQLCSLDREDGG